MEAEIDSLQINVSTDAKQASKGLELLVKQLKALQAIDKTQSINITTGDSIGNLTQLGSSLDEVWNKLKLIRANANINIKTNLTDLNNAIKQPKEITAGTSSFEQGQDKETELFKEQERLQKDREREEARRQKEREKASKSIFSKISSPFGAFRRIAFYRIIRSIIKMMEQALKEGMRNLYIYSDQNGGAFAKALDRMTSSLDYLKNSFATLLQPLLIQITPAIEYIVDQLSDLFKDLQIAMNNALGVDTWTKAIKQEKKYYDTLKQTILGFDELNRMENPLGNQFEEVKYTQEELDKAKETASAVNVAIGGIIGLLTGKGVMNLLSGISNMSTGDMAKVGGGIVSAITSVTAYIDLFKGLADGKSLSELNWELDMGTGTLGATLAGLFIGGKAGHPLIGALMGLLTGLSADLFAYYIDGMKSEADTKRNFLFQAGQTAIGALVGLVVGGPIGALVGAIIGTAVSIITGIIDDITKIKDDAGWEDILISIFNTVVDALIGKNSIFLPLYTLYELLFDTKIDWSKFMHIQTSWELEEAMNKKYGEGSDFNIDEAIQNKINDALQTTNGIGDYLNIDDYLPYIQTSPEPAVVPNEPMPESWIVDDMGIGDLLKANLSNTQNGQQGDIIVQVYTNDGELKSEDIFAAIDRQNQRDGKTIVAVG